MKRNPRIDPRIGEVYRDRHPRVLRTLVVCQKIYDFGLVRVCSLDTGRKTWIKKHRLLNEGRFKLISSKLAKKR